ncbi:NADH-quinone oxidoreductase subunit L [Pontibacillus salicampi]|uniref:NADH-quinone oxidoreductase subunit L n=1 Tax=Pontibacillus salicampi TaxID=1449801 RepID=A0ABV6LSL8_9BACI
MVAMAWIVPLLPLCTFVLCILLQRSKAHQWAGLLGSFMSGAAFVLSLWLMLVQWQGGSASWQWEWLAVGEASFTVGYLINPLNVWMLVIVSLVSFLVHVYSLTYMKADERRGVYFSYLGLFTACMLALVMSSNLLQFYMLWELVGLGSFLLIGFHYEKHAARAAAKKAFIMTRIGDVALLVGMVLLYWQIGSLEMATIFQGIENGEISERMITWTAILLFIGAMGKSGQFPLHTWLPDAMEGPTPVSALIHAATMVAAGVYLVAAMYPLFQASEAALQVVAVVGGVTALFAAVVATVQQDIKRVLAYSTISQLGYMMLALGCAGYVAGVFHLTTHAFFKALLFLAAGSVIHVVGSNRLEEMGGLWGRLKGTGILFLIGTLAITGVPLLSGFFSKEEMLLVTYGEGQYGLFAAALLTAFLTAFYMFRLFFLIFFGGKAKLAVVKGAHKASLPMLVPMVVLGVLAAGAGYINTSWFGTFLSDWLLKNPLIEESHAEGAIWIMGVTIFMTLLGFMLAYRFYQTDSTGAFWLATAFPGTHEAMRKGFFIDSFYKNTFVLGARSLGIIGNWTEVYVINGIVRFIFSGVTLLSRTGSAFQNGQVQRYGAVAAIGLVVLVVCVLVKGRYL